MQWLAGLTEPERAQIREWVDAKIRERPIAISELVESPKGRFLERVAAWLIVLDGGPSEQALAAERLAWLRGGDRLVYLQRMARLGDEQKAFALARSMLTRADDVTAERIERFLRGDALLPEGFDRQVAQLDQHATRADVDEILRFVPYPVRQRAIHRISEALRDADPALRFEVACLDGPTTEAIAMVEAGDVPATAVVKVADSREPDARGRSLWLGLAARAAAARGDHLGVVRLLREALEAEGQDPLLDLETIWECAPPALKSTMRAAGLPVGELDI